MYVQLCSVPSSHAPGPTLQSRRAWCTLTPHVQDYRPSLFSGTVFFRFRISCFCVWVSNIHDSRTRGSRFYENIEILKSCDDYISVYINFLMDTQNIDAYAVTTIYMKAHNTRCTMIIILLYAATNGWPGDGQVSREPGRLDASWLHLGILK